MSDSQSADPTALKEMIINFGRVCAAHGEPDADLKDGHYIMREVERLNRAARAPLLAEIEQLRAKGYADASIYANTYLALTDAMGYQAGEQGLSPEEFATKLRAERDVAVAALEHIKLKCVSLADAQVVALEALAASPKERDVAMPPLSFDRLQSVMAQHFGGRALTDDEADSAETFARAVERAHGIGA